MYMYPIPTCEVGMLVIYWEVGGYGYVHLHAPHFM